MTDSPKSNSPHGGKNNLREGQMCWLCKHALFDRQSGASGSRYRGYCLESMDRQYTWPIAWVPPAKFYEELKDGTFNTDFEEWLVESSQEYYGDSVVIEIAVTSGLHADLSQIETEHSWMCDMYKQQRDVITVSFTNLCDKFERRG